MVYSKRGADLGGDLRFLTAEPARRARLELPARRPRLRRRAAAASLHRRRRAAGRLPPRRRRRERQRHQLLRGLLAGTRGHQHRLRRAARHALLPRRALDDRRRGAAVPDHRRVQPAARRPDRPYARVPRIVAGRRLRPRARRRAALRLRLRAGRTSCIRRSRCASPAAGASTSCRSCSLDLDRPGLLRAAGVAWRATQYELDNLRPGQPSARPRARCRSRASTPAWCSSARAARTISASSRSSRACCICTCPTATRTSCRCSTPALPDLEPGGAVPHQPLRRRGPRERCEPGERRA